MQPVFEDAPYEDNDDVEGAQDIFVEEGAQVAPDDDDEGDEGAQDIFVEEGAQVAPDDDDDGAHDDGGDDDHLFEQEYAAANAPREIPYNLRPRAPSVARNVAFQAAMDAPFDGKSYHPPRQLLQASLQRDRIIFGHVMTQMSAKAGIRKHGEAAESALMSEFAQLENLSVYHSVDPAALTKEQKRAALRAINLIKEKRDGRLKGRTVADGRSQRTLYDKSETASPTVSSDALIISIIIDAHEGRDVATADVAGAYLKADMEDYVLMKFTGESVDILCKMNPEHTTFVVYENGIKVLYARLDKAIYGCVKSALLWYNLFTSRLKDMGFVLNAYDPCIANCDIDGSQCTVAWYVDDNKISHKDPAVVTRIIELIETQFDKMTVTRGNEHVFLGMHIKYNGDGTAEIRMKDYLVEAIQESGMDITGDAPTPATKSLFVVDDKSPLLGKGEAETFHSVAAKLLYVAIRARMDILLAVIFLCTRVSKCTEQDKRKLKRLLQYLNGTLDLTYTVGADDMGKIRSWVDASYAVHPDFKSHTGGVISLGRGGLVCKSAKQKLNTKSSTEAELVGASDYLPNIMWVSNFLKEQGYAIDENILEQDNESAIKLEKNGRTSAGPRSRHIDIRYFWIKDRTEATGIKIRHCPTLQMLGDFFTKPLQGSLFRVFRAVLLGYKHTSTLASYPGLPTEERVGMGQSEHRDTVTTTTVPVPQEREMTESWADVVRIPKTSDHVAPLVTGRNIGMVSRELILSKQSRV
jgi:Reverse transcriptase (RNA-dependent DNA polymerase)